MITVSEAVVAHPQGQSYSRTVSFDHMYKRREESGTVSCDVAQNLGAPISSKKSTLADYMCETLNHHMIPICLPSA